VVKFSTAVGRLGSVAESLSAAEAWDGFIITDAYVFGDLLNGPDSLDAVSVAFVVDLPVEEVPWHGHPPAAEGLARLLRLDKVPVVRRWRPAAWPVWNHEIVRAVRFWSSSDGTEDDALALLKPMRFDRLSYVGPPDREAYLNQLRVERDASRHHLHRVLDEYHEREWQRDHRGFGWNPEDHLWWAAEAHLELDEAIREELADRE
jgi:hypothetical protein